MYTQFAIKPEYIITEYEKDWLKKNFHNTLLLFIRLKKKPKTFTKTKLAIDMDRTLCNDMKNNKLSFKSEELGINNKNSELLYKCLYNVIYKDYLEILKNNKNTDLVIVDEESVRDITEIEEYALQLIKDWFLEF